MVLLHGNLKLTQEVFSEVMCNKLAYLEILFNLRKFLECMKKDETCCQGMRERLG